MTPCKWLAGLNTTLKYGRSVNDDYLTTFSRGNVIAASLRLIVRASAIYMAVFAAGGI